MPSNRFKSKLDALQKAKKVWRCGDCAKQSFTKFAQCDVCGSKNILYFASQQEAIRYAELTLLLRFGKIQNLQTHPQFPIRVDTDGKLVGDYVKQKPVFTYSADFKYWDVQRKKYVVEDVKGSEKGLTERFKLVRKIIEAAYRIKITIV